MPIIRKRINFASYIGIILLYFKLFFFEPIFIYNGVKITISFLLLVIVLIRVLYKLIIGKHNEDYGSQKGAVFFWLFISISTVSAVFLSPSIASGVFTVNLQLFLIYLIFVDFKGAKIDYLSLEKLIKALVNFAILNAILVYYTFFFGKIGDLGEVSANEGGLTRAFGLMGDQVAWFFTFFAVFSLYNKKKYHFIIFIIALLMCASVGATIILIISTLVYYVKEKGLKQTLYLKGGVFILTFFLFLIFFPTLFSKIGVLQRFNQGDFKGTDAQTTGQRYNAILNAVDNIKERPFWGYQNYALVMIERYDKLLLDSEKGELSFLTSPNNQALTIIGDYGLIGFVLFLIFIVGWLKVVRKKCFDPPPYLNAFKKASLNWLIVFLLFNQSSTWFLPGSYLYLLICLIFAFNYKINQLYAVKK